MNTGIQDAHNLAWKISCLLKGAASPSIIKTYETERRPVIFFTSAIYYSFCPLQFYGEMLIFDYFQIAISNTLLSVNNFKAAMSVPAALGLDPTVANTGEITFCQFTA